MKFDDKRYTLVAAIAVLPDEAFNFVFAPLVNIGREAGGFQPASRDALIAIMPIAEAYFANKGNP